MQKILIVEDEKKLARYLQLELTHEGYEIYLAHDGRAALTAFEEHPCDLILLDLMLPELSGIEVCRRIRQKSAVPIIMLTAKDDVSDKVMGLDMGADDYMTKPFAIEELLARIRVALKRHAATAASSAIATNALSAHGVTLDVDRHEVTVEGEPVELTNREFEVLKALMENREIVMSRERLAQLACGYDFVGETNIIDVYIRHLRSKIDDRFGIKLITTVRGVGYVIRER